MRAVWRTNVDGEFVREDFEAQKSWKEIAFLTQEAKVILSSFSEVASILIRGSVLEEGFKPTARDIDFIIVSRERVVRDREEALIGSLKKAAHGLESELGLYPDVRILVKNSPDLVAVTSVTLVLWFRSFLLAGSDILPDEAVRVKASPELAYELFRQEAYVIKKMDRKIHTDLVRYAEWIQKRALRAGGIASLFLTGRYSRHLETCVDLGRSSYPTYSGLIGGVWEDFCLQRSSEGAVARAKLLFWSYAKHVSLNDWV